MTNDEALAGGDNPKREIRTPKEVRNPKPEFGKSNSVLGPFVESGDGGFELCEPVVDRGAEMLDFFGQSEETGVDFVADCVELMVKLGSRDEGVVASLAREQFSEQQGHRGDSGCWDEPVLELAGCGSRNLH
jgi:hypothetical protein